MKFNGLKMDLYDVVKKQKRAKKESSEKASNDDQKNIDINPIEEIEETKEKQKIKKRKRAKKENSKKALFSNFELSLKKDNQFTLFLNCDKIKNLERKPYFNFLNSLLDFIDKNNLIFLSNDNFNDIFIKRSETIEVFDVNTAIYLYQNFHDDLKKLKIKNIKIFNTFYTFNDLKKLNDEVQKIHKNNLKSNCFYCPFFSKDLKNPCNLL